MSAGAFWARIRLGKLVVFRDLARVNNFAHAFSIPVAGLCGKMMPTEAQQEILLVSSYAKRLPR
jgi:hypothetical protein